MDLKLFVGLQSAEGVKATSFFDMGATDFDLKETISKITSERFQSVQAKGKSHVSKIDVGGRIPYEPTKIIFELFMEALGYKKTGSVYKFSNEKPKFVTIIFSDIENNEKWEYVDCGIQNTTLKVEMGAYVTGEVNVIGKTRDVTPGIFAETPQTASGKSLLGLDSIIKIDGMDKTASVEGAEITINNALEGFGALNSRNTVKIKRNGATETSFAVNFNEYDKYTFAQMSTKMLLNSSISGQVVLGDEDGKPQVTIDLVDMSIASNDRTDYKGKGAHDVSFDCSADNVDNTPLKFTFATSTLDAYRIINGEAKK